MNNHTPKEEIRNIRYKKIFMVFIISIFFIGFIKQWYTAEAKQPASVQWENEYGVFIGLEEKQIEKLRSYHTIVIDAESFSKQSINKLKRSGHRVYSYLSIGSIEKFRTYYKEFQKVTLSDYENWSEERWIDVSNKGWQNFVTNKLAKRLVSKAIDGFFIDNADVYYQFPKKSIYNGLKRIIKGLEKYKKEIIVNGGDTFIKKLIKQNELKKFLITGVNQECVFTSINFAKNRYEKQKEEETAYFKNYLEMCKKNGLNVYIIEYGNDSKRRKVIEKYCNKNKFNFYIAPDYQLK